MYSSLFSLLVLGSVLLSTSSIAKPQLTENTIDVVPRSCGTELLVNASQIEVAEDRFRRDGRTVEAGRMGAVHALVNVHFHVVYADESPAGGYVHLWQLSDQLAVLNRAFLKNNMGIMFLLESFSYTQNATWFHDLTPWSKHQDDMKKALRRGEEGDLNLYTVGFTGTGWFGYASFPWQCDSQPWNDGVVVHFQSLPGGTLTHYNLGQTATHEVGHWVGLYHTFEGGCSGAGDFVEDTPTEGFAASGCPADRDTCQSGEGLDPVHNFMDYSYDDCMNEFTRGQAQRAANQMLTYRNVLTGFS